MKVVCISKIIREKELELGKVYEGNLIFDGKSKWENNYLTLEGFSKTEWFPAKCFITLEEWRERKLNELGFL